MVRVEVPAASGCMNSSGDTTRCVVPSRQGLELTPPVRAAFGQYALVARPGRRRRRVEASLLQLGRCGKSAAAVRARPMKMMRIGHGRCGKTGKTGKTKDGRVGQSSAERTQVSG